MPVPLLRVPTADLADFGFIRPDALDGVGAGVALLDPRLVGCSLDYLGYAQLGATLSCLLDAARQGDPQLTRFEDGGPQAKLDAR